MNLAINKMYDLLERIDNQYRDYVLLTESQESKSISAAKKLVMQKFGWNEERANVFVRKELRQDLPALRSRNGGKFILGATRIFCDNQLTDGRTIMRFNRTLELVASDAHINEYDRNLNGLSAEELINRFAGNIKELGDKDREEVAALELQENNDYTIVQIDDFEQARQYGKYTSWCVTHDESMIDEYTSDGIGQFYFCLKNGFENVPKEKGEGCPLDEYGLSMVAVSVDEDGRLSTCTSRWNHDKGGDDHVMDTKQISQLIGKNFYEVFKPNNKWKNAVEDAMYRLEDGQRLRDIFDSCYDKIGEDGFIAVQLHNKFNIINPQKEIISPDLWFDGIYCFYESFARVCIGNKFNFINTKGELISPNIWFQNAEDFIHEIAPIKLNGKWNLINKEGKTILDFWFDNIPTFKNGFASIHLNYRYNFINTKGELLSPEQWFESTSDFEDGIATIRLNNKFNFINTKGELLSPEQWFDYALDFHYGYAEVEKDGKRNLIDKNGNILSPDLWFDSVSNVYNDQIIVRIKKKCNILKTNGKILSPNRWFDSVQSIRGITGWTIVEDGHKKNLINDDGHFMFSDWVDDIFDFNCFGLCLVQLNSKWNLANNKGKLLFPETWFDSISSFRNGYAVVSSDNKYNYLSKEGKLIWPWLWFDKAEPFDAERYGLAKVERNGASFFINKKGEHVR